jgi:glucosamine 6-phosphate synthetase-like amidotransferase/phosphosugar isomerase protein
VFKSDTDTEVLAHLIETAYAGSPRSGGHRGAEWQVDGTYGIAVISSDEPDKIVAARKGSPLLVGIGDGEYYIASDASAILAHTRQVIYLDDGDIAVLTRMATRSSTSSRGAGEAGQRSTGTSRRSSAAAIRTSCSRRSSSSRPR